MSTDFSIKPVGAPVAAPIVHPVSKAAEKAVATELPASQSVAAICNALPKSVTAYYVKRRKSSRLSTRKPPEWAAAAAC